MSRREMSRSIAVRERAASRREASARSTLVRRTSSAICRAATRRVFQVSTAAWPQWVSRAAPISSSETESRARLGPGSASGARLSRTSTVLTIAVVEARRVLVGPMVSRNASAALHRVRGDGVHRWVTLAAIGIHLPGFPPDNRPGSCCRRGGSPQAGSDTPEKARYPGVSVGVRRKWIAGRGLGFQWRTVMSSSMVWWDSSG